MEYANPVFPHANVAPAATKSANPPAYGGYYHHCPSHVGGIWTTTGVILVLFILLVIVSRAWCL